MAIQRRLLSTSRAARFYASPAPRSCTPSAGPSSASAASSSILPAREYVPASSSSSGIRRDAVRHKLARIEATKGGIVSPFLTDSFGREHDYLRISLTEKCNLRCTYCMPENGAPLSPSANLLTSDEIVRLATVFASHGVRKIRLTGGEPTIRRDLLDLVSSLSSIPGIEAIGMTSNGIALSRKLPDLVQRGLTGLNISLDTLDPFKFELMTRRRGHDKVLNAIKQAASLLPPQGHLTPTPAFSSTTGQRHLSSLKLNVVVINGVNDAEVPQFVELTRDLPLSVRFIEYMPFSDNKWSTQKLLSSSELLQRVVSHYSPSANTAPSPSSSSFEPHYGAVRNDNVQALTPGISETAREYRIRGHKGSFGFISSMTDHFCSGCSRLRMTADGGMKVCLFGEPTLSLRDLLRSGASDSAISSAIGKAVKNKHFAHDGKSAEAGIAHHVLPSLLARGAVRHRTSISHLASPTSRSPALPLHMLFSSSSEASHVRCFSVATSGSTYALSSPHSSIPRRSLHISARCGKAQDASESSGPLRLTHMSKGTGKPTMVSVTDKMSSTRSATAEGRVVIPQRLYELLAPPTNSSESSHSGSRGETGASTSKKGDPLLVAQLAGIMGAKKTSELIPLCHPLMLSDVQVSLSLRSSPHPAVPPASSESATDKEYWIDVSCTAECVGATGVEMEALTGVSIACLTVWDMCKAVAGKQMAIQDVRVVRKGGGKSGDWERVD